MVPLLLYDNAMNSRVMHAPTIAVLVPCYNEGLTIGKVIDDFKMALPQATIYVYNNNSSDDTKAIALSKNVQVYDEFRQGKGNVVRSMFREIDADIYILVDGDDTYPADAAIGMVDTMLETGCDMVVGDRLSNGTYFAENKRGFHNFGNNLVKNMINQLFHGNIHDIMTGYRVFNKRFVKCFPLMSNGFEIETEMTIFALANKLKVMQVPINYKDRPEGSFSKLNTFSDGFKVILTIFNLLKEYKPLMFFSLLALLCVLFGLIMGTPVIMEYIHFQYIYKVPSAVLAAALMIIAVLLLITGLIMDYIKTMRLQLLQIELNHYPGNYNH